MYSFYINVNELIQGLENLANAILRVQLCFFSLVVFVRTGDGCGC